VVLRLKSCLWQRNQAYTKRY